MSRKQLYWRIGKTIVEHSVFGNKFVDTLSKDLRMEYPESKGYSSRNLNYMKQFATLVPSEEILQQGAAKIDWRSIVFLINQTKDIDEFLWYANQCIEQGWSSNVLRHQIESGLYNRQVLVEKTTNFRTQLANPLGEPLVIFLHKDFLISFLPIFV